MTATFHPPGAGQWQRDEAHITSVATGFLDALAWSAQAAGFVDGFAHYGAMLSGFDNQVVAGRVYMRPRIAGAPPQPIWGDKVPKKIKGPGKPPPKLIFKLLFALHPELRRRAKRAAEVWENKIWRDMVKRWTDELKPAQIAKNRELTRIDISKLDDAALASHIEVAVPNHTAMFTQHFRHAPMPAVVVGDFMARTMEWTNATPTEVLGLLQGASPASRAGADATDSIAAAIAADSSARAVLDSGRSAADIVAALRAHSGEVGRLVTDYLEVHGLRPLTGLDLYHQSLVDLPDVFVRAIRAALAPNATPASASRAKAEQQLQAAVAAMRARVPEEHRAEFDDAYTEAKLTYSVRDDDVGITLWCMGIVYRAVREAARRLAARKAVHDATHAYDCKPDELCALLRGGTSPSADELAKRTARRAELDALEPPFTLGEAGEMPSDSCFPPAVARMQRAVMAFMTSMNGVRSNRPLSAGAQSSASASGSKAVEGTPVSPGIYEGTARLVRSADDFAKLQQGDVLVARFTSPAYNVVLPLIGAIVTERGGLLSHAAIVAREYGVPGVVDTRTALSVIPDGARVRVDGTTGTVEIIGTASSSPRPAATSGASANGTSANGTSASGTSANGTSASGTSASGTSASGTSVSEIRTEGRVVPLRSATAPEFGGKAKALAAALDAKLPVPDGIALDADLVGRVVAGDDRARAHLTAALANVPHPWAVRSSAIGEDSANASFAGQHATVLGVEPNALLDAIASVHASGHTAAAQAYRQRMGVSGPARMGIVIQTLLRPDISGVLFSRDPTAAREGRVIEATWGLGEALVSGLVTPDRYRVASDGKVLERAIGDKDIAIEAREGGGTAEVEIKADRAKAACLDDARIAELAQLASRCEQLFGGPQDLEWAVANGRLHLLQSRPVTTNV